MNFLKSKISVPVWLKNIFHKPSPWRGQYLPIHEDYTWRIRLAPADDKEEESCVWLERIPLHEDGYDESEKDHRKRTHTLWAGKRDNCLLLFYNEDVDDCRQVAEMWAKGFKNILKKVPYLDDI